MKRMLAMLIITIGVGCTPMSQDLDVGDGSIVESKQQQDKAAGAKVDGDVSGVVSTINEQGIDVQMLLIVLGSLMFFSLLIGMILPRPKFVKWFFE